MAFRRFAPSCQVIYPDPARQELITSVICTVKTSARFLPQEDEKHPLSMLRRILSTSVAPVVLGCTDLRGGYENGQPLDIGIALDSLECLADAIVDFHFRSQE